MESLLSRGSNGQAVDLVFVKNSASIANGASEFVTTADGASTGRNIEGALALNGGVGAVAHLGTEILPTFINSNDGLQKSTNTTIYVTAGAVPNDDDFIGQTLRVWSSAGATLADASPLSGSTLPASGKFGPKGYKDVVIADSTNDATNGGQAKSSFTVPSTGYGANVIAAQVLPAAELTNGTGAAVAAGDGKAIAFISREK